MQEAKEAAARRGELRLPLPIGYAYDIDGQVVLLHGRKHAPGIGFRLALPSTSSLPAPRGALYRQVSTTREEVRLLGADRPGCSGARRWQGDTGQTRSQGFLHLASTGAAYD